MTVAGKALPGRHRGPLDHRVRQPAEPVDLHLDDVAREHRARVGRRAREDDVAGEQCEVASDVLEQGVDPPYHLRDGRVLHHRPVDERAQRRLAHIDPAHETRPERTEAILTLDPEHRAGVGVTEVVQAGVVRWAEPGEVIPHVVGPYAPHRSADDRRDLAFVVQELAVGRTNELAAMPVECRCGLDEVRGVVTFELAAELSRSRQVVQVHAHDRARFDRADVQRRALVDRRAVFEHEAVSLGPAMVHAALVDHTPHLSSRTIQHAHAGAFPSSRDRTKCDTASEVGARRSRWGACPHPSSTTRSTRARHRPLDGVHLGQRAVSVGGALHDQDRRVDRRQHVFDVPVSELRRQPDVVPLPERRLGVVVMPCHALGEVGRQERLAGGRCPLDRLRFDEDVRGEQGQAGHRPPAPPRVDEGDRRAVAVPHEDGS